MHISDYLLLSSTLAQVSMQNYFSEICLAVLCDNHRGLVTGFVVIIVPKKLMIVNRLSYGKNNKFAYGHTSFCHLKC